MLHQPFDEQVLSVIELLSEPHNLMPLEYEQLLLTNELLLDSSRKIEQLLLTKELLLDSLRKITKLPSE